MEALGSVHEKRGNEVLKAHVLVELVDEGAAAPELFQALLDVEALASGDGVLQDLLLQQEGVLVELVVPLGFLLFLLHLGVEGALVRVGQGGERGGLGFLEASVLGEGLLALAGDHGRGVSDALEADARVAYHFISLFLCLGI